ncbi:glycosyltransferase family A protein [Rubripirellula reticaptiva]|uniref:Putative glycosyltransferase EpsH n=1 Tax=Rubripirellula reticaptiva TaxID=2528013 RepID=A0A5C6F2W6_9BACT|nr:glycosyltransferase family 2 protein [Rubripirellula reticaptiva]TWU55485.1 putative glycosyltransferase EpsH [Rubripirellula reticaptiva]
MLANGISVVVCCFNSESVLPDTLQHLKLQTTSDDLEWEVVIVDNASTDTTTKIASEFASSFGNTDRLRIVAEPTPGLSNARKAGVFAAKYQYLIFCDDDNHLCPSYVESAYNFLKQNNDVNVVGGTGTAVSAIDLPHWFASFQSAYACGPQASEPGPIGNRYLYGAGMAIRTEYLRDAYASGFEHQLSDRSGQQLSSGGDGEIQEWLSILSPGERYFLPSLTFDHRISEARLSLTYLEQLYVGFGQMLPILQIYRRVKEGYRSAFYLWIRAWVSALAIYVLHLGASKSNDHRQLARKRHRETIRWLFTNRKNFFETVYHICSMHDRTAE